MTGVQTCALPIFPPGAPALRVWRHSSLPSRPGSTIPSSSILPTSPAPFRKLRSSSTHVGGPVGIGPYKDKKAETFAQWEAGITEVARSHNVVVKLGGLAMRFGMFDFYARDKPPSSTDLETAYRPYIETCIAAFGVDRSMFESNFPPDEASSSYPILWNAFKRLAAGSSASEKAMLFSGTAKRVYRLA